MAKIAILALCTARWSDGVIVPCLTAVYESLPTENSFLQTFIVTGPSLVAIPVTLIFGKLADYVSKKRLLMICIIMCIIGGVGGGFVNSMEMMAVTRVIVGVGTTVSSMLIYSIIGELFDTKEAGSTMGLYQATSTGYGTVITAVAGILAVTSWRNAFLLNGVAVVELLLVWLFLPATAPEGKKEPGEEQKPDQEEDGKPYPWLAVVWIILGMMLFSALAFAGYYCVDLYVQDRGLGTSALSGIIGSAYTIGSAVGALTIAGVYANLKKWTPVLMFGIAAAGFILLSLTVPAVLVLAIMFVTGIMCGCSTVYFAMRLTEEVPKSKLTKTMSVQTVMLFGSLYFCAIIPKMLGNLFHTDSVAGQYLIIGIILAVGAVATAVVKNIVKSTVNQ